MAASISSFASFSGMPFSGRDRGVDQNPADGQARAPVLRNFDRNLVVGAAHAAGLHFEQRLGVLDGLLEDLERIVAASARAILSMAP